MDTRWNKKSKIYIAVKTVLWAVFLGAALAALANLVTLANRASKMEDYYQSSQGFRQDLIAAAQGVVQGIKDNDMQSYANSGLVYAQTKDGKIYQNEWTFDSQAVTGSQLVEYIDKQEQTQQTAAHAESSAEEAQSGVPSSDASQDAALVAQEAESTAQDDASAAPDDTLSKQTVALEEAVQQEAAQEEVTVTQQGPQDLLASIFDSGITLEIRDGSFLLHNMHYFIYSGSESQMSYQQMMEDDIEKALAESEQEITRLVICVPQELLVWNSSSYYEQLSNDMIEECLVPTAVAGVIVAISGFALLIYAGRKADGTLRLFWIDHVPTEFHVIALAVTGLAVPVFSLQSVFANFEQLVSYGNLLNFVYAMLYLDGLCMFALLLSLVRKLKGKRFFKGSITYWFFHGVGSFFNGDFLFRGKRYCIRNAYRILWVAALCVAVFLLMGFMGFYWNSSNIVLLLMALAFFGTAYLFNRHYRDMRDLDVLLRQIENIADHQSIDVLLPEKSPLKEYEERLTHLNENLNENVKQRMAAERMKLDLITNVSHDLKTPLTSIIGYVDLLNKMNLSGEAGDYVKILQQKADRLSDTVSDLFTLAKSTSGSDELHLEPLDLVTAVNQVLADFADRIEAAQMPIKTTMPGEAWVQADSSRIYRVLQNLLDNALRYSLKGTRIFLTVSKEQQSVCLTVLNTAGYEMNFSAQEIVQRFVRGDKSRTEEGSGLGLSIAESFMENFGGDMKVSVEGDTFRVVCTFLPAQRPAAQEGSEPQKEV